MRGEGGTRGQFLRLEMMERKERCQVFALGMFNGTNLYLTNYLSDKTGDI